MVFTENTFDSDMFMVGILVCLKEMKNNLEKGWKTEKPRPHLDTRLTRKRNIPRGRTDNRNHGKTMATMARQKNTSVRFWRSISDCMARRTSTEERQGAKVREQAFGYTQQ